MILCSDGLHGLVEDEVIADVARRLAPTEACQELVQRALQAGGHDNVSVGVFRVFAPAAELVSARDRDTRRIPAMSPAEDGGGSADRATRQLPAFERQP
jgi:serine/threonine protein phosphatase PrpC